MTVRVRFLGTGDAFNARGRCHASYLVEAPSTSVLLDCGASALLAMQRDGVEIGRIETICLSHLHGDHFAGLPFFLIASIFDQPRTRPLHVVGPPGTADRVQELFRAMYRDLSARPLPFELRFTEVQGDLAATVGAAALLPFPVPHQLSEVSLGYRLTLDGRTVVYSGDTGWTEALVIQARGADLFICECCFFDTRVDFHLDYPRIAAERHRFECGALVLSHLGREVLARRADVRETLAEDGLVVPLD